MSRGHQAQYKGPGHAGSLLGQQKGTGTWALRMQVAEDKPPEGQARGSVRRALALVGRQCGRIVMPCV